MPEKVSFKKVDELVNKLEDLASELKVAEHNLPSRAKNYYFQWYDTPQGAARYICLTNGVKNNNSDWLLVNHCVYYTQDEVEAMITAYPLLKNFLRNKAGELHTTGNQNH